MLTNLRKKLRCLWQGHTYREVIWPGYEDNKPVFRVYQCKVCKGFDYR